MGRYYLDVIPWVYIENRKFRSEIIRKKREENDDFYALLIPPSTHAARQSRVNQKPITLVILTDAPHNSATEQPTQ